jgi:hypothetical protein
MIHIPHIAEQLFYYCMTILSTLLFKLLFYLNNDDNIIIFLDNLILPFYITLH